MLRGRIVQRSADAILVAVLLALAALLLLTAFLSRNWMLGHDTSILHYVAFLLNEHQIAPYRDAFEVSFPGTYLVHAWIGKLLGYGTGGFATANLSWLLAMSAVTGALMRRFGWRAAWTAVLVFGVFYFQGGRRMMLQRDALLLLPLVCAILLLSSRALAPVWRALAIGVLVGLAATVKPHAAIALPLLVLFEAHPDLGRGEPGLRFSPRRTAVVASLGVAGLVVPILAALGWVLARGGLPAYLEMVREYLPLYVKLTGEFRALGALERLQWTLEMFFEFGGGAPLLIGAAVGSWIGLFELRRGSDRRRMVVLLIGAAGLFSVYSTLGGKLFPYHWMPFHYFMILLGSLCLVPLGDVPTAKRSFGPVVLILTLAVVLQPTPGLGRQLRGEPADVPLAGRLAEISSFLEERLEPGDLVQPLDFTGGAIHAMLLTRARLATSYLYDYYFYHDVSQPYIQTMRRRFLAELAEQRPRFMIRIERWKPWVRGKDTTRDFAALDSLLRDGYTVALTGDGYAIYERND